MIVRASTRADRASILARSLLLSTCLCGISAGSLRSDTTDATDEGAPPPAERTATADDAAGNTGVRGDTFEEQLAAIDAEYGDEVGLILHLSEVTERYLAAARDEDGELAPDRAAQARLRLAEIQIAAGHERAARTLWAEVSNDLRGEVDLRMRAIYRLGAHYFFREYYTEAHQYWRLLPRLAADHELTRHTSRYTGFLELAVDGGLAPDFAGRFGKFGAHRLSDFRGRQVLLDFWRHDMPDGLETSRLLRVAIDRLRNDQWKGLVLGINLDTDTRAYREALKEWKVDFQPISDDEMIQVPVFNWPQHHDGKGFDSPIVRALGIPRVPLRILIDERGYVSYVNQVKRVAVREAEYTGSEYVFTDGRKHRYLGLDILERRIRAAMRGTGGDDADDR